MNDDTQKRYRKLATNFYATRMSGEITAQRIVDALKDCAEDYRPDYFRKLRNALAFDQDERGYKKASVKINATKNPVTLKGSNIAVKPKLKRVKSISDEDTVKLINACNDDDIALKSAIRISHMYGCRPAELFNLKILENGNLLIVGAKKSNGNRGLDREVKIREQDSTGLYYALLAMQQYKREKKDCKSTPSELIQAKFANLCKKTFTRRSSLPSLYSFRHQLGSNLKSSEMTRLEIAYVMGHQSTKSVDAYGNKRSGNSKVSISAGVDNDAMSAVVRVNHTTAENIKPKNDGYDYGYGM